MQAQEMMTGNAEAEGELLAVEPVDVRSRTEVLVRSI